MTTRADSTESPASAVLDESLVGQRVQKYEIVRVIGRGGMGMVYEALNTTIGKRVAMKFVDAEMARNKDAVARFQREAQAASAVESAHIVEIFDSGTSEDGLPFIVMELLRGEDLGHRIKRCGRLELGEAVHIIAQILRGLHRAHAAGIVHRDLKPDNIFLVDRDDDQNFAKILDFGISKVQRTSDVPVSTLTRQGTVLGTPFYMSPEQAQALSDIDGRTDLWSVGAILYECLTGRPPYGGATYEQVIINICMKDAEDVRMHNPGVPEGIAQVIQKALARERDARFASAREFLDALATATGGLVSSRPGRGSADEFASLSSRRSSGPNVIRSDPPPGPNGFAPTVEVHPAGTSKVGWSTSGKAVAKRERRRFAMVAVGALAIGSVGALLVLREKGIGRSEPTKAVVAAPVPAREIALRLTSKAANARFFVNDAELPGGVLKGHPGDTRLVWVKTDGMQPFAKEVSLHEGGPASIELDPPEGEAAAATAPQVVPAGDASSAASAEPAKPPPVHVGGHVPIRHPPPGKPEPPATAVHVTPPPPQGTGIAGGLQLKKD